MDVLGIPRSVSRLVTLTEERRIDRKRRKKLFLRRWTLQTPTVHRDWKRQSYILGGFSFFKSVLAPTMACVITLLRLWGCPPKITILALKSKTEFQVLLRSVSRL